MATNPNIALLQANLAKLNEKDREAATSLIRWANGRGLSPKQDAFLNALALRATKTTPAQAAPIAVGDVTRIVDLLEQARKHLTSPAFVMQGNGKGVRVSIAGAGALVPNSITVTSIDRDPQNENRRTWYGRITRDGGYQAVGKLTAEDVTEIATTLRTFAADPAGEAAKYGRLHGRCCFCMRALKDERSTAVGYGGTCAAHYELPWGD